MAFNFKSSRFLLLHHLILNLVRDCFLLILFLQASISIEIATGNGTRREMEEGSNCGYLRSKHLRFLFDSPVHIAMSIFGAQILRMHHETLVRRDNVLIVRWANQIGMFLGDLVLRDELRAHVRRPEVLWSRTVTTKSLLELRRVENICQCLRSGFAGENDLLLCYLIYEDGHGLIETALTPADVRVKAAIQEGNEVILTQLAKCDKLLSRQGSGSHIIQVAYGDPLINLARQK